MLFKVVLRKMGMFQCLKLEYFKPLKLIALEISGQLGEIIKVYTYIFNLNVLVLESHWIKDVDVLIFCFK